MYDNVIIHSFPNDNSIIHAVMNFRKGKKIMISLALKDVSAAIFYMGSHEFCKDLPYRIITHKI